MSVGFLGGGQSATQLTFVGSIWILWTYFVWSVRSSGVAINMSSMYTVSQPSSISSLNIAFIMAWKVAGEFVRPKNMTIGSYSPSLVMKAAFHSSPALIRTLLYPQRTSNLVNSAFPLTRLISWGMRGSG